MGRWFHRHRWFKYTEKPVLYLETGGVQSPFSIDVEVCFCKEARLLVKSAGLFTLSPRSKTLPYEEPPPKEPKRKSN